MTIRRMDITGTVPSGRCDSQRGNQLSVSAVSRECCGKSALVPARQRVDAQQRVLNRCVVLQGSPRRRPRPNHGRRTNGPGESPGRCLQRGNGSGRTGPRRAITMSIPSARRYARVDGDLLLKMAEVKPSGSCYKVVVALCFCLNRKTGKCHPSAKTISRLTGLERANVWRAIREAEQAGLIWRSRVDDGGRANMYQLYPFDSEVVSERHRGGVNMTTKVVSEQRHQQRRVQRNEQASAPPARNGRSAAKDEETKRRIVARLDRQVSDRIGERLI